MERISSEGPSTYMSIPLLDRGTGRPINLSFAGARRILLRMPASQNRAQNAFSGGWTVSSPLGALRLFPRRSAALGGRLNARLMLDRGPHDPLELRTIPESPGLVIGPVWQSPDQRHLVVQLQRGDATGLEIIPLTPVWSRLLNRDALIAIRGGDLPSAASLLERAIALDPSAADAVYNLACVLALQQKLDGAEAELRWALALDRPRILRLARVDPDLAVLRARPEVSALLGLSP